MKISTRDTKATKSCKCQNAPIIADAITKGFPAHKNEENNKAKLLSAVYNNER